MKFWIFDAFLRIFPFFPGKKPVKLVISWILICLGWHLCEFEAKDVYSTCYSNIGTIYGKVYECLAKLQNTLPLELIHSCTFLVL